MFDEESSSQERHKIASALSDIPRPDSSPQYFKAGKVADVPLVCSVKECVGSSLCMNDAGDFYPPKSLASLVPVRLYLLFNLLKIEDLTWLEAPVCLWPCFPTYVQARDFVRQLLTVNDGAERGIKLMQELIDRTQDEMELQYLAQCVTQHRQAIGHTKKDYDKLDSF